MTLEVIKLGIATLAGVPVGLVVGYIPSLLVWALVGAGTQGASETGGWAEAGSISGVVWLATAGTIVGFVQQRALPPGSRRVRGILLVAAIWALAHPIAMLLRGRTGDVDLGALLPFVIALSFGVGVVSLAAARSNRIRAPRTHTN